MYKTLLTLYCLMNVSVRCCTSIMCVVLCTIVPQFLYGLNLPSKWGQHQPETQKWPPSKMSGMRYFSIFQHPSHIIHIYQSLTLLIYRCYDKVHVTESKTKSGTDVSVVWKFPNDLFPNVFGLNYPLSYFFKVKCPLSPPKKIELRFHFFGGKCPLSWIFRLVNFLLSNF